MDKYILVDGIPMLEPDLEQWMVWYGSANLNIVKTEIGNILVSTDFLGLDHDYQSDYVQHLIKGTKPVLWETMVFDGNEVIGRQRYRSKEEAVAGYREIVANTCFSRN